MSKPLQDSHAACPICHKPVVQQYRPFCSKHCADIDLGRWFSEGYAIPAVENDEEDAEPDDGIKLP